MLRHEVVSIVAGGWSVKQVDQSAIPGFIIGINDAALCLPRVDAVVSMDRLWTEHRWEQLRQLRVNAYIRKAALKNIKDRSWPWLHVFECDHTSVVFSSHANVLNGTNSGVCGLNLGWQIAPRELYLFGFDMQAGPKGELHWYPDYPWETKGTKAGKFAEWAGEFRQIAHQFEELGTRVFNVSDCSRIVAFSKMSPTKFQFRAREIA